MHATNSGALQTRRDDVAKLDEKAARDVLRQVESELQGAPSAGQVVNDAVLSEARNMLADAASQLKDIDGKIREKRGALQQVGGEVARQRAEDAGSELQSAKDRAQEVELEFNAWELLRKTLRDAEQEEGTHLGHALAGPIAERFAALTARPLRQACAWAEPGNTGDLGGGRGPSGQAALGRHPRSTFDALSPDTS